MQISDAFEATDELGEILDRVEAGAEVVVTRRGKAVAKLLPLRRAYDIDKARAAADAIRTMSIGAKLGHADLENLIEEGRRWISSSTRPRPCCGTSKSNVLRKATPF